MSKLQRVLKVSANDSRPQKGIHGGGLAVDTDDIDQTPPCSNTYSNRQNAEGRDSSRTMHYTL